LQELIAGKPPFDTGDLTELQAMIRTGAPRKLRVDVPDAAEGLELVILRCLEKNKNDRFDNVVDLASALAPFGGEGAALLAERVGLVANAAAGRQAVTDRNSVLERPPTPLAFVPISERQPPVATAASPRSAEQRSEVAEAAKHGTNTSIARDADYLLPPPQSRWKAITFSAVMSVAIVGGILGFARYRAEEGLRADAPPPPVPVAETSAAPSASNIPSVAAAIDLKPPAGGKTGVKPARAAPKPSTSPSAKSRVFDDRK
jgi:serine/threonine-protein kinase